MKEILDRYAVRYSNASHNKWWYWELVHFTLNDNNTVEVMFEAADGGDPSFKTIKTPKQLENFFKAFE